MGINELLLITLVMYIIGWFLMSKLGYWFSYLLASLWLIPILNIDNPIVIVFSVAMVIIHLTLPYIMNKENNDTF